LQREFWSKGDATENFVVVQCTYSFPHILPDNILALMLSHMTKYGRILLLTSEGAAFQMGAVQTVILKHEGHMGKQSILPLYFISLIIFCEINLKICCSCS